MVEKNNIFICKTQKWWHNYMGFLYTCWKIPEQKNKISNSNVC